MINNKPIETMKKTWTQKIGEYVICVVGLTIIVVTTKRRMQSLFAKGLMTLKFSSVQDPVRWED